VYRHEPLYNTEMGSEDLPMPVRQAQPMVDIGTL